jgi:hypothetical protein
MQSITSPIQISSSPARGLDCSDRRGCEDRVTAVRPFRLIWRKLLSITSLSGGGKVATLSPDLPVICHGEILNTCKSRIQQPRRSRTVDILSVIR